MTVKVKVNLFLALKTVKKIARLRNQSSLNLRTKKINFEDKHMISMDKTRKARSMQLA